MQNLLIRRVDEGDIREPGGEMGAFGVAGQRFRGTVRHFRGDPVLLELRDRTGKCGQVFVLSAADIVVRGERIVYGQKRAPQHEGLSAVVDLRLCQSAVEPEHRVRQPGEVGQLQMQPCGRRQLCGKSGFPQHRLLLRYEQYAVESTGQRVREQLPDFMAFSGTRQPGDESDHRYLQRFVLPSFLPL